MFSPEKQLKQPWAYSPSLMEKSDTAFFRMLAAGIIARAGKRRIVFWGPDPRLREMLENTYHVPVEGVYGVSAGAIGPVDLLKGKSETHFLVVPLLPYAKKHANWLSTLGFETPRDVFFREHEPVTVPVTDGYRDSWDNEIHGTLKNATVTFHGYGCRLEVGKYCTGGKPNFKFCSNAATIRIGNQVTFVGYPKFIMKSPCAEIVLEDRVKIRENGVFITQYNSKILVGADTHIMQNCSFSAHGHTEIHIGRKCLMAADVICMAGDGHSILDVKTGKNINSSYHEMPENRRKIVIGEHVWIGRRAFVMGGAEIGNGSVIGAMGLVKKKFPNNCVIAGNPARLLRRDITWNYRDCLQSLDACDPDYIRETVDET